MTQEQLNEKIRVSLNKANMSWANFMSTLTISNSNIQRRDFNGAEAERLRLHTLLDDYLDQYLIAGQLAMELDHTQHKGKKS